MILILHIVSEVDCVVSLTNNHGEDFFEVHVYAVEYGNAGMVRFIFASPGCSFSEYRTSVNCTFIKTRSEIKLFYIHETPRPSVTFTFFL
jgi:hypothetical protein